MDTEVKLWEVLVPTMKNEKPVRIRYHRVWDAKVREIAGGLSLFKPVTGQWKNPDTEELCVERMIPVRIACTRTQIETILDYTIKHYDQHTCMAYLVSQEIIFRKKI